MFESSSATGIDGNQLDTSATQAGAVYVFVRNGTVWSQQAYVKASNTEVDDQFGGAVALSADGNTLAVGAIGEDSAATGIGGVESDNSNIEAGAVYVFIRTGTTWGQQAYVKAANTDADDWFGYSVALSDDGNELAVAAFREDGGAKGVGGNQADNSAAQCGAAYVFTRTGTTWSQDVYLKPSNAQAFNAFGVQLAVTPDGSRVAVGALGDNSGATGIGGNDLDQSAAASGAVFVFERVGATWTSARYVKASNTNAGDGFGSSVALAGDGTLAVGATDEDSAATGIDGDQSDNTAPQSGAVYVVP
jgi:hypothetical protein